VAPINPALLRKEDTTLATQVSPKTETCARSVNLLKPERSKQDPLEHRHQPVAILLPPHKPIFDCGFPTTLRTAGVRPLQFSLFLRPLLPPSSC